MIVEFALVLPLLLFTCLGFIEAGFLVGTQTTQQRETGLVADWIASHPGSVSWHEIANLELPDCDVTADPAFRPGVIRVGATCHYTPRVTNGLGWSGLPISTTADAVDAGSGPTESPSPSPAVAP